MKKSILRKLMVLSMLVLFFGTNIVSAIKPMESNEEWIHRRRFLWKAPDSPPPIEGYPVLLVLHGGLSFAESWFWAGHGLYLGALIWGLRQTKFVETALKRGYFVIAPDSTYLSFLSDKTKTWDTTTQTFSDSLDLPFIQDIFDWIANDSQVPINTSNIFCAGFSAGGFMTSRIAHYFGSKIKAIAVHSATNANVLNWKYDFSPQNFSEDHPPTIVIQGGKDTLMPAAAAIHFYEELQRNGIKSELLYKPSGHHIWLSEFNNAIFDWFENVTSTHKISGESIDFLTSFLSYQDISKHVDVEGGTHSQTTWYVGGIGPDNYSKIQDAIDNASDGDIVFVYDEGSPYNENLLVNREITLVGEDRDSTVIDGRQQENVINVTADGVKISRFTIQNCGKTWPNAVIHLYANNCTISDNTITHLNGSIQDPYNIYTGVLLYDSSKHEVYNNSLENCFLGILLYKTHDTIITDNKITNTTAGIYLQRSNNNNIITGNNVFYNREEGIYSHQSSYNTITTNTVSNNNRRGIDLYASHGNIISKNMIKSHRIAISLLISDNNEIFHNALTQSRLGIDIWESIKNTIKENNFIKNTQHAKSKTRMILNFSNTWEGNYWGRPRLLPKPIPSFIRRGTVKILIPWIFFDLKPAKQPYEIT
jgi:parallel beta-helix repeat protein